MTAAPIAHVLPKFGLPYAEAGVAAGKATATCPVCGDVFSARTPKGASSAYAAHFAAQAALETGASR